MHALLSFVRLMQLVKRYFDVTAMPLLYNKGDHNKNNEQTKKSSIPFHYFTAHPIQFERAFVCCSAFCTNKSHFVNRKLHIKWLNYEKHKAVCVTVVCTMHIAHRCGQCGNQMRRCAHRAQDHQI